MYDENLIEESLAFCKEIKTFFDEDTSASTKSEKTGTATTTPKEAGIAPQVVDTGEFLKQLEAQAQAMRASLTTVVPDEGAAQKLEQEKEKEKQKQEQRVRAEKEALQLQERKAAQAKLAAAAAQKLREQRAEQARLAEEARAAEQARLAEEARVAEQARLAEEARAAEQARLAEEARVAEQARLAEEARVAEQARLAEEARAAKQAQQAQIAAAATQRLHEQREKLARLQAMKQQSEEVRPETPKLSEEKQPENRLTEATVPLADTEVDQEQPLDAEEVKPLPENPNRTLEIKITFDFANLKKLGHKLKEKLQPDVHTMEDVSEAMEENRQIKAEKNQQDKVTVATLGASVAHKAKGLFDGKEKKEKAVGTETAASTDDIMEASYQAAPVDSVVEEDSENRFHGIVDKLVRIKDTFTGHLVSNVIILIICVGIAYFFASFFTNFIAHETHVEGESMEPTLSNGDSVFVQKVSYYFHDPERFDVVVFPVTYDSVTSNSDTFYIKRVIGLPGETVQILDGNVYINGEQLKDDKYALSDIADAGVAAQQLKLGENEYFVMGDNRNMSTDSRNSYVGLVNGNDIIGEAWVCLWPLNHFGSLKR